MPAGVDVWRVQLDPLAIEHERFLEWLSLDERSRAQRFHSDLDRAQFVVGRGVLRWLLGRYLVLPPALVELVVGSMGKPRVAACRGGSIHFNLSHSHGLAVYVFSKECELGVDVELIRPVPEADSILRRHFSQMILERWLQLPVDLRPRAFLQAWVEREAMAKREGCGLVGLEDSPDRACAPGRVIPLVPGPGYVGALAVSPPQT